MSEIVACYVVCNEEEHLADSLRSLKAYVDSFVIVDVVFDCNPLNATHSTDGTRAVAEKICAAWPAKSLTYIESEAKLIQSYARNVYLEQVSEPDWVFVVDGDEILYGDHQKILNIFESIRSGHLQGSLAIPVYTVAVNVNKGAPDITDEEFESNPHIATMGYMPRLFAARADLRYTVPPLGHSTPVLTYLGDGQRSNRYLLTTNIVSPGDLFLINNHVRQSLASYKNDWIWEVEEVRKAAGQEP